MSDDRSARLTLPYLYAGQAQKEITHNEALALLDIAVQAGVIAVGIDVPPANAAVGACWIVGDSPVGDWAGHARTIAGRTAGGWRFVAPRDGMRVWSDSDAVDARFTDGAWRVGDVFATRLLVDDVAVVGPQRPAIALPTGGAVVDGQSRVAIAALVAALTAHGLIAS